MEALQYSTLSIVLELWLYFFFSLALLISVTKLDPVTPLPFYFAAQPDTTDG